MVVCSNNTTGLKNVAFILRITEFVKKIEDHILIGDIIKQPTQQREKLLTFNKIPYKLARKFIT
jgi:hypothetical protein